MKYCDLHCDALTAEGEAQVTRARLAEGGCLLQCFAAFVSEREGRFRSALSLADKFDALCKSEGYNRVCRASEIREDAVNALLTVEEGGAIEGDLSKLRALYARGVRMMTLTWNYPNEIGYPCFPFYDSFFTDPSPDFTAREETRGLTAFGREAVEEMNALGMIVDVSHGSDKLVQDVAELSRVPFVASHSGARSVYDCARNLTDEGIRLIADSGGAVGLDFCADFLSDDKGAEGQFAAIVAHARAIVAAGGEDVLAIGSDFDGIPENPAVKNPAHLPRLLEALADELTPRVAEKCARSNFLRVFREVCK